jgi:hypothetical protein
MDEKKAAAAAAAAAAHVDRPAQVAAAGRALSYLVCASGWEGWLTHEHEGRCKRGGLRNAQQ